jgi:hypothetical protein
MSFCKSSKKDDKSDLLPVKSSKASDAFSTLPIKASTEELSAIPKSAKFNCPLFIASRALLTSPPKASNTSLGMASLK